MMSEPSSFLFISGLPRSGSTLIAAQLRQNPMLRANITRPLGSMVNAMLAEMSAANESAIFVTPGQREAVLRGLFTSCYGASAAGATVFDTMRVAVAET